MIQAITDVFERINKACARVGRDPKSVLLLAASKGQSVQTIKEYLAALKSLGLEASLGENYIQELKEKRFSLPAETKIYVIGALQSNKVKDAVTHSDGIQTVDSERLALAVEKELVRLNRTLDVFVQVNISRDSSKHGVAPEQSAQLIHKIASACPHLKFCGLMAITKAYEQPEDARADFAALRKLGEELSLDPIVAALLNGRRMELSMGMSSDFEVAIEEGATCVRIGTAIFGMRE